MLKRVIKTGWINFRRNPILSLAATAIMCVTLMLFLGLLSFHYLTDQLVATIENKIDISVYFKMEAPEKEVIKARNAIQNMPEVANVEYISREQALAEFKIRHKDSALITESFTLLDDNPLRALLNVRAHNPDQYATIATGMEASSYSEFIDKVTYTDNRDVISRIERLAAAVNAWGFITTIIIAIIAVLVTFNTVRLTIYNQRQEIEIMRLVGASNWQIRGPYLVEGALYGLFAAGIGIAIFAPLLYALSSKVAVFAPGVDLFAFILSLWWEIILLSVGAGIVLGMLSSLVAIRKHLRV